MNTVVQKTSGRLAYYREVCQKGSSENYLFDKYVFRHISIFPTIVFIKLGIQPNTATLLSLLAAVGSCFFLVSTEPIQMLIGALLIFTYYTLDHVDGELARYYIRTGRQEPALSGQYFDVLVHSYTANIMVFSLGISVYHQLGYWWVIYAGFIGCVGMSNFPNLVAGRVLMQKTIVSPDLLERLEAQDALTRVEGKRRQVEAVQGGIFSRAKLEKLVAELADFPGPLILIILVVIADALWGDFEFRGIEANWRLLLLMTLASLHIVKLVTSLRRWLRLFRPIR